MQILDCRLTITDSDLHLRCEVFLKCNVNSENFICSPNLHCRLAIADCRLAITDSDLYLKCEVLFTSNYYFNSENFNRSPNLKSAIANLQCRLTHLEFSLQHLHLRKIEKRMFWSLELASYLEDAPWPATKDELIDYAIRSGAPIEVVENLQELEDEGEIYESIEDIWPDYPSQEDFLFNEDEY